MDAVELPESYVKESNAGRIVGLVGLFHFIALAFTCMRVYVRKFLVHAFSVDDGLIIVATVGTLD